jgi:hypothetical protein
MESPLSRDGRAELGIRRGISAKTGVEQQNKCRRLPAKITLVDDLTGFKASQTKFGPALMRTELRRPKKIRSA